MANKNQILLYIVSFLIFGFFLLSIPETGVSGFTPEPGGPPCCDIEENSCTTGLTLERCRNFGGLFFPDLICPDVEGDCVEPPSIPTLNQYGMITMAGVLGLFAVIGLFVMRRGSVVKPSS